MQCYTFLYARRSSDDDDHQTLSLDAQEKECRAFAHHRGLAISEMIRESHSARRPGRPLFQQMLQRVAERAQDGQRVVIFAHKPDRLLRNLADWARLNDLIDAGVELLFVTGSYPNNAQGKMAFGVNVLFAKYYVDNLSEEVHKGIREKLSRGEWPAMAPLGYRNVRDRSAPERVVLDPETAPLVQRAFEYYASGEYSLAGLAKKLETEGLVGRYSSRRLTVGYLQDRILRNAFYCGLMPFRGQLHPGVHPALISLQLFETVQQRMRSTGRPRPQRHFYRYRGIFRCTNCQAVVIAELKKEKYLYYRCNHHRGPCREGYIREEELEWKLRQRLRERITLREDVATLLREGAERLVSEASHTGGMEREREALERQIKETERRLSVLLDMRLAGHLSEEQYTQKRQELVLARARAAEALERVELPTTDPQEPMDRFISFCNDFETVFEAGDDNEIRVLLGIVGLNYRIGGKEVDFEPVEPFGMAAQAQSHPQWRPSEEDVRKIVAAMQEVAPHLDSSSS
jgi:DNA invertase Pin-like site-specific DNA recombinase